MRVFFFKMRLFLLLGAFAASFEAKGGLPQDDAKTILLDVRKRVMLTVGHLPKYLCTETVDRSVFWPEANVFGRSCDDVAVLRKKADWKMHKQTSDRLRLDVAVSTEGEMFSWVGENRFQDRSLADLVAGGATSTGTFAALLGSIFGSSAAQFTYNGDVDDSGRSLAEFGFRVPVEKSRYRIGNKSFQAIV